MISQIQPINFSNIAYLEEFNNSELKKIKIHNIHSYPAKLPPFLVRKIIEKVLMRNSHIKSIADIFCGCGTVAVEAKLANYKFWGCDLNPVAVLITKTKLDSYNINKILIYTEKISENYEKAIINNETIMNINDRINYWYDRDQIVDLLKLKNTINETIPMNSRYKKYFLTAFSDILKISSKWLQKSIKPQINPLKKKTNIIKSYRKRLCYMKEAVKEINENVSVYKSNKYFQVKRSNFLNENLKIPNIDLIITSPPYTTSYEYADLHQLSSLWLDFTSDFRELRKNSIGSIYGNNNNYQNHLNSVGEKIVKKLYPLDKQRAKAVSKYYYDMQNTVEKTYTILNKKGVIVFIIGNTEYKKIKMKNVEHIYEAMGKCGYKNIDISKRKISNKILTPYRDEEGKFSKFSKRKIYNEEFVIIGEKL